MVVKKKVVLLGDSAVGKTSLIRRYVFDKFDDSYISTIGSKVTKKELKIQTPNKTANVLLMIWDIIGREGYQALHARTIAGTDAVLLVADLTRKETLESLERYWIPIVVKVAEVVPMAFVCNKSDLEGQNEFELDELGDVASRYNSEFQGILPEELGFHQSTSAKTGTNVEETFRSLGHLVLASEKEKDPLEEIYGFLAASSVAGQSDITSPMGALDAIMVDFCKGMDDERTAMMILRQEITRAGLDIKSPSKIGIIRAVEYLAEAENEYGDEKTVMDNLRRRMRWAKGVKE
jgi:small GTP-binding protein